MSKYPTVEMQRYELERSPLYKLSSKRKLAALLGVEASALSALESSGLSAQYNFFTDPKTRRFITEPIGDLLLVHKRLLKLFSRVAPPDYIHSAIKKRSYKTNAVKHVAAENVLKIDIKKFFPSVKFHHVHNFFLFTLQCSTDIATILAKLCTTRTKNFGVHLPTGSCISPILSFLANRELFDSIKAICDLHECVFTLYVDDITISGKNASRELLTMIAVEIHRRGYRYHKIKTYHCVPATITGLIVSNGKLGLPHIRAKKIRELGDALSYAKGPIKQTLLASLIGRLSEAEQINPAYKVQRHRVLLKHASEWGQIMSARLKKERQKKHSRLERQLSKKGDMSTSVE